MTRGFLYDDRGLGLVGCHPTLTCRNTFENR